MDKQRLALTALILLPFPLLAACGTESGSDSGSGSVGSGSTKTTVTGVHWNVDSLTVDGKTEKAPDSAYLQIADDGEVNGNYGCNGFGTTATVKGDTIAFGTAQSTDMACLGTPMEFEEAFAGTLTDGEFTAERADGKLTLTSKKGATVKLSEEKPAELYGTKWQINSLMDHEVAQSLPEEVGDKAWFTLDEKSGKLTGSLGCNRVTAEATVSKDRITLGNPGTTRRMCSDSLMAAEKSLLKLFKSTLEYRIDHRTITLTSENDLGISAVADK
ncbi:META domain-containing protein [Streptomyces graminofaciens]|jgi:heat shock protein HslJ|nr:META domain-containing protein [Streptomyces graminofaciens]